MSISQTERILVIGIDGADWPSLRAVMRAGLTPNLSAIAGRGAFGSLRPGGPQDGLAPWATMASGHPAMAHGVYRDSEAWAGGLRPTGRASWRKRPVWAALEGEGVSTGSVGWPGIAPGDSWPGQHVDESYATASGTNWDDWALPLHCAPRALREALRDVRVHPSDIGAGQLLPLVPDLAAIDQTRDVGLPTLAVGMARTATIQAGAVHLLGETGAQAIFVHHRWLSRIRQMGPMAPPWDHVLDGAWRFLDGLIGRLATIAGEHCTVMIASPGWQDNPGVALAAGPGIRPGSEIVNARLIDIAPTVLSKFGLCDPDMAGSPVGGLGIEPGARDIAPASEAVLSADDKGLERLAALGYAAPPPVSDAWRAEGHLLRSRLLLSERPREAGEEAAAALALMPDLIEAIRLRARAHVMLGEAEPLTELGDALLRLAPNRPWGNVVHGAAWAIRGDAGKARPWLEAAATSGEPDTMLRIGAAWLMLNRPSEAAKAFAVTLSHDPACAEAAVGGAMAAAAVNDLLGAEKLLRRFLARDPQSVPAWLQLAAILERAGRNTEAVLARRNVERFSGSEASAA